MLVLRLCTGRAPYRCTAAERALTNSPALHVLRQPTPAWLNNAQTAVLLPRLLQDLDFDRNKVDEALADLPSIPQ